MGASTSKLSLQASGVEDVSDAVYQLGNSYRAYASLVRENAIDGSFLSSLNEDEIGETLEDLGVTNRLHKRLLAQKIQQLKDGAVSLPAAIDDRFESFDEITLRALDQSTSDVFYCGMHLVQDAESYLVLSAKVRDSDRKIPRFLHRKYKNQCSFFVQQRKENFYEEVLWCDYENPPRYFSYVLKDDAGHRIGTVCMLDGSSPCDQAAVDEKKLLLKGLAAEAERQIRERKAILEHTASLEKQLQASKGTVEDVAGEELHKYMTTKMIQEPLKPKFDAFDEITFKALDKSSNSVFYCGMHLVQGEDSYLVLSANVRGSDQEIPRFMLRTYRNQCAFFVRERTESFYEEVLWSDYERPPVYSSHVLKDSTGKRIGTLCMLDGPSESDEQERQTEKAALLKELAADAESQIHERQALLDRTASLERQIQLVKGVVGSDDVLGDELDYYIRHKMDPKPADAFKSFDEITLRALDHSSTEVFYCGMHLVLDQESYLVLSANVRGSQKEIPRFLLRTYKNQCSFFVRERQENFYEEVLWCDYDDPPRYYSYVLKDDAGKRIGTVCMLEASSASSSRESSVSEKELLLKGLASEAQRQINERKAILDRTASLERQLQLAKSVPINDVLGDELDSCIVGKGPKQSEDFSIFDEITFRALDHASSSVFYCGMHLVQDHESYLVLSANIRGSEQQVPRFLLRTYKNQCSFFARERQENFYEEVLWCDYEKAPVYSSYVLKDSAGKRIGTICMLDSSVTSPDLAREKETMLKDLASEAERQMHEREALLERTASLQRQIQLKQDSIDDVAGKELDRVIASKMNTTPEPKFEAFDAITLRALDETSSNVFYCGMHLVQDQESYLVLSANVRGSQQEIPRFLLRTYKNQCSFFVRERTERFYEEILWCDYDNPPRYYSYALKDDCGKRIGTVCMLDGYAGADQAAVDEKEMLLKGLAAEAERQIKEQKALLERTASLERQMQLSRGSADDVLGTELHQYITTEMEANPKANFALFDEITLRALDKSTSTVFYCGLHLVRDSESYLVLSGRVRGGKKTIPRFQLRNSKNQCMFVRETKENFYEEILWCGYDNPPSVFSYILNDEDGKRIGTICVLDEVSAPDQSSSAEKQRLLRELAAEAERQITERKAILERLASLEHQIQSAKASLEDIAGSEIQRYMSRSSHRRQREPVKHEENSSKRPKTSHTPTRNRGSTGSTAERHAIVSPSTYSPILAAGDPAPPVQEIGFDAHAIIDDMGLTAITPGSPVSNRIKKLVEMTARVSEFAMGMLVFDEHLFSGTYGRVREAFDALASWLRIITRDEDRIRFPSSLKISSSIRNYSPTDDKIVVIPDISKDSAFQWLYECMGIQAFVGCPLVDTEGRAIATLCIFDTVVRNDLTKAYEAQIEQSGYIVMQELQNWALRHKMERLERERSTLQSQVDDEKSGPPERYAAIVRTDIEGSTSLWELDAVAMKVALDLHHKVIRQCYGKRNGYEIGTEGDSFLLAFHDPVDAISFAIDAQRMLHQADWPAKLLAHPQTSDKPGSFRGLRVRMGVHYGPVETRVQELTRRIVYSGEAWYISQGLEEMAHGGQILTTLETWNMGSWLGEMSLGDFQLLDLGAHILRKGESWDASVVPRKVVQIVPGTLAYDYSVARRQPSSVCSGTECPMPDAEVGRVFPPVKTRRQIGPSFHDAPYADNQVAMMFLAIGEVETEGQEKQEQDKVYLSSLITDLLLTFGSGYHCKEFMIAFAEPSQAVLFSFKFFDALCEQQANGSLSSNLSERVKFGIVFGPFLTMTPNKMNGRADYFGNVVNRAARVADAAAPGTCVVGERLIEKQPKQQRRRMSGGKTTLASSSSSTRLELGSGISTSLVRVANFKGVSGEMSLFECRPSNTAAATTTSTPKTAAIQPDNAPPSMQLD